MLTEILSGLGAVGAYYALFASGAVILRALTPIRGEYFRKLLHLILLGSLPVWTFGFQTWYLAALSALLFAAALFPALSLLGRIPGFTAFMTERKSGEMRMSLILVFVMYAAVVTICWGMLGEKLIALCSIYAWGFGDACAAIVGKRFGRRKLTGRRIEGVKSVEGSIAMFAVSFISVLVILLLRGGMAWYGYLITSLLTALVSAVVELFTKGGRDTITCPLAAMCVLVPMIHLFGGGIL